MYTENPYFEKPQDENVKIWRYMDFAKLVSILDRKALFFIRVDRLTNKFDKFEGALTQATIERMRNSHIQKLIRSTLSKERLQQADKNFVSFRKLFRKLTVVNCWHMNEWESDAMWKLYAPRGAGIAIQSTFKQLKESFNEDKENQELIGMVKYIDFEKDLIPHLNTYYPYMFKRHSFAHERELRVVITNLNEWFVRTSNGVELESGVEPFKDNLYVPVNLNTLISEIHVSPTAKDWLFELTQSIMDRYDLNKTVIKSPLSSDPYC